MDRCLTIVEKNRISYGSISLLTVACFDIAYKCVGPDNFLDHKWLLYFAKSDMNELPITELNFDSLLKSTELGILKHMKSEPISPTPFDYIYEVLPSWADNFEGRRAALLCAAFIITPESTIYTSMEIAAAAVLLVKGQNPEHLGPIMNAMIDCLRPEHVREMHVRMLWSVDRMFSLEYETGFSRFHRECKISWLEAAKKITH